MDFKIPALSGQLCILKALIAWPPEVSKSTQGHPTILCPNSLSLQYRNTTTKDSDHIDVGQMTSSFHLKATPIRCHLMSRKIKGEELCYMILMAHSSPLSPSHRDESETPLGSPEAIGWGPDTRGQGSCTFSSCVEE